MNDITKAGDFIDLYKTKKQTVFSIVFLFLVLSTLFTFLQPLKYSTESSMMVVQSFSAGTDPYVASKSNEYLSNVLSNVILSGKFFDDVMASGFDIDKSYFTADPQKKMKRWTQTVSAKAMSNTGIINIGVYHIDKYQSSQISRAINYVLQAKHSEYHGSGNSVSIKIIDQPITSAWIAKPNIPLNIGLGAIFGFVLGLYYIYLFPEARYDFKLFSRSKKKDDKDKRGGTGSGKSDEVVEPVKTKVNYLNDNEDLDRFQGNVYNLFRQSS